MKPYTRHVCPLVILGPVLLGALACASTQTRGDNELQMAPSPSAPVAAITASPSVDGLSEPPKGCRGGNEQGSAAIWALEFQDADSPWRKKGWERSWREWATSLALEAGSDSPLTARVLVLDNWTLVLRFERDEELIASEILRYQDPCVYAHEDREHNVMVFYRKRA